MEHGLLMENLLDLAHAPFTHTSTFAKGWPIPDAVRFHTQARRVPLHSPSTGSLFSHMRRCAFERCCCLLRTECT